MASVLNLFILIIALLLLLLEWPAANAIQRCNIEDAETHALRIYKSQEDQRVVKKAKAKKKNVKAKPLYELRVVFHVIMNDAGSDGYVPLDSIQANIDSANHVHSGGANTRRQGVDSKIRLFLAGVTYTNNSEWFNNCQDYTTAGKIKFATAISAATTVNIWTCSSSNLLGWVHYLPYELAQHSVWNGVNLNFRSLPLSKSDPTYTNYAEYSDGDTFTHELGHFLGLLHTFGDGRNGCSNGDDVDDTPPEETPAPGNACLMDPPRKTCPNTPGVDPVWNIMDYVDDFCAEEFTNGQIEVMRYSIEQYKPLLIRYEPMRCVTDGQRGTATKMTVCKSECFTDRTAPDGRSAPATGWCRTDAAGNWGQCCCKGDCFNTRPSVNSPATLSCGRKQEREELLRSLGGGCAIANIGGGAKGQVTLGSCKVSEFARWAFNWDGTIASIGAGWCLAVLNLDKITTSLDGRRVGLEPCAVGKTSQRWTVLPVGKSNAGRAGTTLALQAAPEFCIDPSDGTFVMRTCSSPQATQKWQRIGKTPCESLKSRAQCINAPSNLGCSCRWVKNRCVS